MVDESARNRVGKYHGRNENTHFVSRFIFVCIGPEDGEVDYHEIGRCISTLMANKVRGPQEKKILSPIFVQNYESVDFINQIIPSPSTIQRTQPLDGRT